MRTRGATGEVTRQRVHEAAVRVFARKGFTAAGVRELAQEAGITSAALYHYMERKEDLLLDIMRSAIEPLADASERVLDRYDRAEVRLAQLVELHVWMHGVKPAATLITDTELRSLSGEDRADMLALRDRYESIWRTVVADGVAEGGFEVADERIATNALLELCNGVSLWFTPRGRLSLEEVCAMHADLALGMVRATRERRPVRRSELSLPNAGDLLDLP